MSSIKTPNTSGSSIFNLLGDTAALCHRRAPLLGDAAEGAAIMQLISGGPTQYIFCFLDVRLCKEALLVALRTNRHNVGVTRLSPPSLLFMLCNATEAAADLHQSIWHDALSG